MTQRAPGIRETLGVCETLAAMTEQVLLATGITPDDPERAHWRSILALAGARWLFPKLKKSEERVIRQKPQLLLPTGISGAPL